MDVISVINYKGGVGKTTTTANLAAEMADRGQKVLLIDLDPQASLTFSFIRPEEWERDLSESKTIKKWFDELIAGDDSDISELVYHDMKVNRNLRSGSMAIIPSHLGLINVDLELATQLGGANIGQAKRNYVRIHRRLAKGLPSLSEENYDIVLIDCSPNFNIVTKTAIVASQYILVPAKPDYLSTLGITYLQRNLLSLVADFNDYASVDDGEVVESISPEILGVIFTMVQFRDKKPITAHRGYMRQVEKLEGIATFRNHVRDNKTIFGEAPEQLLPVVLNEFSQDTYKNIVRELKSVTDEFEERLANAKE